MTLLAVDLDEEAQILPDIMDYFLSHYTHTHHRMCVYHLPKCLCVKLAQGLSLTSLKLCLAVPRVFLQALLLVDDDVLNVLHGQVVAEGVEQDVFQLLQGDPLHVELQEERDERGTFSKKERPFSFDINKLCVLLQYAWHDTVLTEQVLTHVQSQLSLQF